MFNIPVHQPGQNARPPIYDPDAVQWMRDELTYTGFKELLTVNDVNEYLADPKKVTVLVLINSVCGCAAGSARPGVNLALQHKVIPDYFVTAFAGMERDAVDRSRELIGNYPPSSPSAALFKNGELVHFIPRYEFEGRAPSQISAMLTDAFDEFCTKQGPSISPEDYAKLEYAKMCGSKIPKINN